jgi:hypothetical protein
MIRHNTAECLVISVSCIVFFIHDANAQSCRNFAAEARAAIGSHVTALQRIEHEASDRAKGLDSRPFEFLLGEARKTTATVADPAALKLEEGLERCRNWTQPIRKMCATAAQMLIDALEKHVANAKPDYDKAQYAAAIEACEKSMGVKPLKSAIRGTE